MRDLEKNFNLRKITVDGKTITEDHWMDFFKDMKDEEVKFTTNGSVTKFKLYGKEIEIKTFKINLN
jgi:hypothetical protein